jgi:hypothetical protein
MLLEDGADREFTDKNLCSSCRLSSTGAMESSKPSPLGDLKEPDKA